MKAFVRIAQTVPFLNRCASDISHVFVIADADRFGLKESVQRGRIRVIVGRLNSRLMR